MKNILLIIVFLSFAFAAFSQAEIAPPERYRFQFLAIDKQIALPGGNTATRPTPVAGKYWIRYNTDSLKFEYSTGSLWNSFNGGNVSVPTAWGAITGTITSPADLLTALGKKVDTADLAAMFTPYLKTTIAAATYASTSGSYANPPWITSLAWNKLTAVPSTFNPSAHTHALSDLSQSTASNGQVVQWNSSSWVPISLTKALVGLSHVDDTPDSTKPVSNPQALALSFKQNLLPTDTVIYTGTAAVINRDTSFTSTCGWPVNNYDKISLTPFINKRIRLVAGGMTMNDRCNFDWYFDWNSTTGVLRIYPGIRPTEGILTYQISAY